MATPAVEVAALCKTYRVHKREPGLRAVKLLADYWSGFGDPMRLEEALAADAAI